MVGSLLCTAGGVVAELDDEELGEDDACDSVDLDGTSLAFSAHELEEYSFFFIRTRAAVFDVVADVSCSM